MNQTALVTGGSSGIGLEIVRALVARGDRVLTCGSRSEIPAALSSLSGVEYLRCDLARADGTETLAAWAQERAPRLDWLFNNAGIQNECQLGPALPREDVEREIAVNLTAPIALSCALIPALEGASGCVVNLSSGLALAPKAASPVYCATKAGLSSFSRTLRYQLEPRGIRVADVITPLVKTPMTEGRHDGAIDASAFVSELLSQLASGRDEIYIGKARLLRWVLRLAPGRAYQIMRNA